MKPWKTLKDLLVHPKDKQEKEDIMFIQGFLCQL